MGIKIDRERFALGNYQYLKYSPELFFDTAEELGIRNVELWGAAPQFYPEAMTYAELSAFGRKIRNRGLKVVCITPELLGYPFNPAAEEEGVRKAAVRYVKRYIEAAGELDCPSVLVTAGSGYYDHPAEDAFRRSRESLYEICVFAQQRGITMLLETLTPPSSNVLNTPEQQREIAGSMPENSMFPILDLGQMAFMEQDLGRYLAHGDALRHVHLHDTGDAVHMALGEGRAPLLSILETLEKAGYRHLYSFECNDPRYRKDPAAADRQNVRWLEEQGII